MSENDLVLDATDKATLSKLERKMEIVRVAVRGLVGHFHTGLFLWGEGGVGKSYTVYEELRKQKAKYVLHNSRLTARGLVDALERAPDDLHLIEDAETLFEDRKAAGVLRSALHSQSKTKPPERTVTWSAFNTNIRFIFTGSIIVISNSNLAERQPEIRAIKTRINVLRLDVTNAELLALMKRICGDGFHYGDDFMTPDECWCVATFIRDSLWELQRPLDLRLLTNGFRDFVQWKNNEAGSLDWTDLLTARIKEAVHAVAYRRADRIAEEKKLAIALSRLKIPTQDKIERFNATGSYKSTAAAERAYYRRLQGK